MSAVKIGSSMANGLEQVNSASRNPVSISGGEEFRRHWFLLLAAFLGALMLAAPVYATGVFLPYWQKEFGWGRGEIAMAIGLFNGAVVLTAPVMGRIVSIYGVRKPALTSLAMMVICFGLLSQMTGDIRIFYALYILTGVLGAGSTIVVLTRPIAQYFDAARGMAMSVVTSSIMTLIFLVPAIFYLLVDLWGWRAIWLVFALITAAIWPVVFFGLKDVPVICNELVKPNEALKPVLLIDALRKRTFWVLALSCLLLMVGVTGPQIHIVPVVTSMGIGTGQAVIAASAIAAGVGVSRLIAGFLVDRIFVSYVFQGACAFAIAGCVLLIAGPTVLVPVAAFMIGMACGAEGDLLAFSVSRYFGLHNYSQFYGLLYSITLGGAVISPVAVGYIFDIYGSYRPALLACGVALVFAALLMRFLPAYPPQGHVGSAID